MGPCATLVPTTAHRRYVDPDGPEKMNDGLDEPLRGFRLPLPECFYFLRAVRRGPSTLSPMVHGDAP